MSQKYYSAYKKLFIRYAFRLYFSSASYNFINFFAVLLFSRAKKPARILLLTDKLLNKKICECQRLHQKCKYLDNKLKKYNKKYVPV